MRCWRLSAVVSLAVSLVLSLSSLATAPVAAAPPDTIREATESSDIAPDSETKTESPPTAETPEVSDKKDQLSADVAPRNRTDDGNGSVRQRGVEAPVLFEEQVARGADRPQEQGKSTDKPDTEKQDPGDGPVKKPTCAGEETGPEARAERYSHLAHAGQELHVYPAFRVRAAAWKLVRPPCRDAPPTLQSSTPASISPRRRVRRSTRPPPVG